MQENIYKIAVTKRQLIRDSEFYELLDNFINMSDLEKSIHLLEDAIKYADSYSMYFEHMDYYKPINNRKVVIDFYDKLHIDYYRTINHQKMTIYFNNKLHREWAINLVKNKIRYLKSILEERNKENEKQ